MAFFFNALIIMKSMSMSMSMSMIRIKDGGASVVNPDRSLGSLPREE